MLLFCLLDTWITTRTAYKAGKKMSNKSRSRAGGRLSAN